jgi:hypothetical protein
MRYLSRAGLMLSLSLVCLSVSTARAADETRDPAANAALQYWKAFSFMPTLDKDQEKLLDDWSKAPLDDAATKLIADSQNSLMFLHRAANAPYCDWGLDYNDGMSLLLPHLQKARDLTRLAALRARYEFEHGNKKTARDDATAMMTLARHVGRDPIMICILVQYVIEGMTIDLLAPHVPELKVPPSHAREMFDRLPKAATLAQTLPTEKKYMAEWAIRKLREAEQAKSGSWRDMWNGMLQGGDAPETVVKIATYQEAMKLIEDVLPVYGDLEKLVALPPAEFAKQYPPFKEKTKAANPLAGTLLPAIDKVRNSDHRNQARMAMLLAAIAVAQDGPDALKSIKDPFGDGPFEYRRLDTGFELTSKLLYEDKPVTLIIGQRKKD